MAVSVLADTASKPLRATTERLISVDAYRGLVMFLMLAEVLSSCAVSAAVPGSSVWRYVCTQQTHAAWVGSTLHDLIQPGFYFLVGVALLFSIARRRSSGEGPGNLATHTIVRSCVLIVLGMALLAVHPRHWTWWFGDTLTQIGLAYPFLVLVAVRPKRDWYIALGAILVGYWLWFALFPLPPPNFDYSSVGVPSEWLSAHRLAGFDAHWQKNSNASWAFDRWFLNLFPTDTTWVGDRAGLTTLNFIPSIGTMILGLMAADVLRAGVPPETKVRWLSFTGLLLMGGGWLLGVLHVCPVVKAIWTPTWVLFSGGACCLFLAAFYALVDLNGFRRAVFPLTVVGANSIVAYSLSHLYPAVGFNSLRQVFGPEVFESLGQAYEPFLYGCGVLATYWLVLSLLYRQRIFLRV